MEKMDYKKANFYVNEIKTLNEQGQLVEGFLFKEFQKSIGRDINAYLIHLMEVENIPVRVSCFGFQMGFIDCFDGMAWIEETELGEYCVETLENESEKFNHFNRCTNCDGKGYTEEINCSTYSGSDCCGGCYVEVQCDCEEHKMFKNY